MEKRLRKALDDLKGHADQSVFSYTQDNDFADGINHAVQVIEAAMESELTEKHFNPEDPADPNKENE